MINKLHRQIDLFLEDLTNFSVSDLRKNTSLLGLLKDENLHAIVLWDRIKALKQSNDRQLSRIIGQIELLNVVHPERIGEPHSSQVVSQLRSVLYDELYNKWYSNYSREVYEAIIDDLELGGVLAKYVNEAERLRTKLGIATPIPLIEAMQQVEKAIGKSDLVWTADTVKYISYFLRDKSLKEMAKFFPTDYVFTTTGFRRNQTFEAVRPFIRSGGTYVEVGASVGIYAVDVKKMLGFKRVIATDIMSESQAKEIVYVTDYEKGGRVPYTEDHRKEVEKNIDIRLWKHNILKEKIAPYVSNRNSFFCFGFHNILVHLIDKDIALQNAIEGLIKPGDVIWVSGGYCANEPIFRNLIYQRTSKGVKVYLIYKNQAIPLNSLDSVAKAVREGRRHKLL